MEALQHLEIELSYRWYSVLHSLKRSDHCREVTTLWSKFLSKFQSEEYSRLACWSLMPLVSKEDLHQLGLECLNLYLLIMP